MKSKSLKLLALTMFVAVFAVAFAMRADDAGTVLAANDVAAEYKAKCQMCHSPKAEKAFDPSKSLEHHIEVILKGDKTSKPPMPGYEAKGMTQEQAKALAEYMLALRKPPE